MTCSVAVERGLLQSVFTTH